MSPTLTQLQALVSVIDQRSFEGGARALHISVGALSQRIAGLERAAGHPVVTRTRPVEVTGPGEALLTLARQIDWLVSEHRRSTAPDEQSGRPATLALAVNADSLSTWFKPMLRWFAKSGVLLHLRIEDQDRTAQLLHTGEVTAAVSTRHDPPPGCRARAVGTMRYLPACAPELLPPDGLASNDLSAWLRSTPTLRFDTDDGLPGALAEQFGITPTTLKAHLIPSNREYLDGVRAGLGWSVLPEDQVRDDLATGALVRLPSARTVDVPLYWHRWRLASDFLDAVDAEIERCARVLRPRGSEASS